MLPTPPEGLRHWRPADAPALAAAWADPVVSAWNPTPDVDPGWWIAGVEQRWERGLALDLVVDPADDGTVAGEVGLSSFTTAPARAELGVWVAADHRRRGVADRAVRHVADWVLRGRGDVALDQLWARTDPANEAAQALFDGLGWARLGESGQRWIWAADASVLR